MGGGGSKGETEGKVGVLQLWMAVIQYNIIIYSAHSAIGTALPFCLKSKHIQTREGMSEEVDKRSGEGRERMERKAVCGKGGVAMHQHRAHPRPESTSPMPFYFSPNALKSSLVAAAASAAQDAGAEARGGVGRRGRAVSPTGCTSCAGPTRPES